MIDPSLAPVGKHTLHAYTPATEPYALWEGLDRRSPEYKQLKEERSQVLWDGALPVLPLPTLQLPPVLQDSLCCPLLPSASICPVQYQLSRRTCALHACCPPRCAACYLPHRAAVRKLIPDIDSRVEVSLVGTPLTHERFLRRHRGTYGPGEPGRLAVGMGAGAASGQCRSAVCTACAALQPVS